MASHQPIEQHAQRGQVLLDGRRGELFLQMLDEGGDVERMHVGELADSGGVAPSRETVGCVEVCLRVWSLLIWAVKNSSTRLAAFGVGVNSAI